MTNRLAECDQDSVVFNPMPRGQHGAQRDLRLVGSFRAHQAPSIRDAMHMSIDADTRLRVRLGHDQVRGLAPDAFERQEGVDLVRHASIEFLDQVAANSADDPGLGAIKADRKDEPLESLRRQREYRLRRMRSREQSDGRRRRGRVLGAQTQDARNQCAKRIAMLHRDEAHNRRIPRRRLPPEHGERTTNPARIKRQAFQFGSHATFIAVYGSDSGCQTRLLLRLGMRKSLRSLDNFLALAFVAPNSSSNA